MCVRACVFLTRLASAGGVGRRTGVFYGMNGGVTQTDGRGLRETIISKAAAARRGRVDGSDLDTARRLKIADENKQAARYRAAFPPSY